MDNNQSKMTLWQKTAGALNSVKMSQGSKINPNELSLFISVIRGSYKSATESKQFFIPSDTICPSVQQCISDLWFVCTQFAIPSVNGIECLNEINWLAKYWYGFVFPMQASFGCDTIDILSEFWFLSALAAFILSVFNSFCLSDRNSWWKRYVISRGTKRHFNLLFWMQCDYLLRHY